MKTFVKRCATNLNLLWSSRYGRIWLALTPALAMCYGTIILVYHTEYLIQAIDILDIPPFYMADVRCHHCSNYTYPYIIDNKESDLCTNRSVFLLFLVVSAPSHVEARSAIRKSWGDLKEYRGYSIHTVFIVGNSSNKSVNDRLQRESKTFNDVVQLAMNDSYQALTNKSIAALQWALQYCVSAKFLVKTDDDSLNVPHRYVDYLIDALDYFDIDLIAGYRALGHFPSRSNKWRVSLKEYPNKYYPPYVEGRGYIVSRSAAMKLVDVAPNVRHNGMEDVFVTGLCRVQANIACTDLANYGMPNNEEAGEDCNLATNVLNMHYVKPHKMHDLYYGKACNSTLRRQCFYAELMSSGAVGSVIQLMALLLVLIAFLVYYKRSRNSRDHVEIAT